MPVNNAAFPNNEDLMVIAAWLYYDDRLTHEEIARRLNLSRVAVTRLLQRARQEGIVQITITRSLPIQFELENRLLERFHLKNAIVVKTSLRHEDTLDAIGRAGAQHLKQTLFCNCRLGVAWSQTVSKMAPYIEPPEKQVQITITEVAGTILEPSTPFGVSWRIADKLKVPVEPLPVPVLVQSEAAREAILDEASIQAAMEHANQCDIAIFGLGNVDADGSLVRVGLVTPVQMAELRARGAVGDIFMRFYDQQGRYVPTELENRIVAIQWNAILRIPYKVGMAAGDNKVLPILGALNGGLLNCLITDTETARKVLAAP